MLPIHVVAWIDEGQRKGTQMWVCLSRFQSSLIPLCHTTRPTSGPDGEGWFSLLWQSLVPHVRLGLINE